MRSQINRVEHAIDAFKQGKMVILTDDPGRENEGDLIIPAELCNAENMNFMIRHGSGIVCLSMASEILKKLELSMMVPANKNNSSRETPFTVSIDAAKGISTGVSASDRVATVRAAIADNAKPSDLVAPGHMFPLLAKTHGVFERDGHTEGSVDLARIAGFKPAAVICELMQEDGDMLRGEALTAFAEQHDIPMLSINDIITYRLTKESIIHEESSTTIKLDKYGEFHFTVIREKLNQQEHVILFKQPVDDNQALLTRIHSSCVTGDIFHSQQCDCHKQLHYSLDRISAEGGILIYLNQEGRGIGLFNKIKAYDLQHNGLDTVEANHRLGLPADARNYRVAFNVLCQKGYSAIRLLTNNPAKLQELCKLGLDNIKREPMPVFANVYNKRYLTTKRDKLNHLIDEQSMNGESNA